ncbi:exo-beta-N-acetylmuramidase NamZ domain-containing protein [Neptunicella sp. SCSIO 80796]|uniref:exo-beta-N-acetylmuramidase NamZ family protein n=1 Tax=Neptunicella plasticusilytica TaxID=3117012 RepID=UPI003A4D87E4
MKVERLTTWYGKSAICCLIGVVALLQDIFAPALAAESTNKIEVGASQTSAYLPLLKNKRVGLVVNQTSRVGDQHLVDFLLSQDVDVKFVFAPEHGFRGDHDAGAKVDSSIDADTGIPVVSIYGKNKKPAAKIMQQLDVIIFDIQDVGVRFYTYLSSMHYMMEAAAEAGKAFIVFDRPNPNGRFVDGPILEPAFRSFVGMHPIPVLHGMTLGELARMIKGEGWLETDKALDLTIIPVDHYRRELPYSLPVKPSPNLPNDQSIQLYPSLCFFEATPVSIGRGTEFPFQVVGHDQIHLGSFSFTPHSIPGSASNPKLKDVRVTGQDLRTSQIEGLDIQLLLDWQQAFADKQRDFFDRASFMDKLAGTDKLRLAIEAGQSLSDIRKSWQPGLKQFKTQRKAYLLYPDYPAEK